MNKTTITLATGNPHKLKEVQQTLEPMGFHVQGLDAFNIDIPEPVENQPTFEGNARLKALYYAKATNMICLADDSGLSVTALDDAPGVYSARYSGIDGPRDQVDQANNAKLIQALKDVPFQQRHARFICVLALASPEHVLTTHHGEIHGLIQDTPKGENGFGYDPHFFVPHLGKTTAELSPDQKNSISHRGNALRLFRTWLSNSLI